MMTSRLLGAALLVAASATAYAQPAPDAAGPSSSETAPADTATDPHDADLAAAADATAEAAAVAPPGETAPAGDTTAADAAAEDIDLASLGLDPASVESSFDDKLNIYGFADFNWQYFSGLGASTTKSFSSGKLNVYFAKNLSQKFRALAEVRFMFLPNGASALGEPATPVTAPDPTSAGRNVEIGSIGIQRAYVEYDLHKYATVRAGHFLTPYGIWNIDHGSPAITPTMAPYMIGERLFPEAQTGLQVFGSALVGEYRIGYAATVSNGRSTVESTSDPDNRVALGGRLEFEAPWAGSFKAGVSAYGGRATVMTGVPMYDFAYNERDIAVDAQWDHGPLHVQAEYVRHQRNKIDSAAAPHFFPTATGVETDDAKAQGGYGLVSYRFSKFWNVMPFGYYEHYRPLFIPMKINTYNGGLNFRPTPSLVLKVQGTYVTLDDAMPALDPITVVSTQAAWVF